MLKTFLTRNIGYKILALILAIVLWALARYWIGA